MIKGPKVGKPLRFGPSLSSSTSNEAQEPGFHSPSTPKSLLPIQNTELAVSASGLLHIPSGIMAVDSSPICNSQVEITGFPAFQTTIDKSKIVTNIPPLDAATPTEKEINSNETLIKLEGVQEKKEEVGESEPEIKAEDNDSPMDTIGKNIGLSSLGPSTELANGEPAVPDSTTTNDNHSGLPTTVVTRYAHDEPTVNFLTTATKSPQKIEAMLEAPLEACQAHRNLFLLFHNTAPEIDAQNINEALRQIEIIIEIARPYGSIPTIRHHLISFVHQFGRGLFKAILENPPRWLFLSIHLECAPIFKEAIIHLVGQYPRYLWTTIPYSKIPRPVLNIIRKKVNELRVLKASIDGQLFSSSIAIEGQNLTFHSLEKSNFDTWFVVQLWRDWFCHSLSKHAKADSGAGATYRLMRKGGNAYLDHLAVYSSLVEYRGKSFGSWNLKTVETDLKIMKDYAKERVKDLVVNHSMLDVEEAGIQYLTCTKVENDELPWIKKFDA